MPDLKIHGIVLAKADFGEQDRMLTLLTPDKGIISVAARGCRKQTSKTLAASECFVASTFVLSQKDDRYTVSSVEIVQAYYPLREDYEKLAHGSYWLELVRIVAIKDAEEQRLFLMLAYALTMLAFGDLPVRALTSVFLLLMAQQIGFAAKLDVCVHCRKDLEIPLFFDGDGGGVCCQACRKQAKPLSVPVLLWMREAVSRGAYILAGRQGLPAGDQALIEEVFDHLRRWIEITVNTPVEAGKYL